MTWRAIALGLLLAAFIAGVGFVNDFVLQLTYLVGNHFPIFVFGGMVLFLMVFNPALRKLHIAFSGQEMAVIISLMLAACCIPSSGLLRTFTNTLAMPASLATRNRDWGPTRNDLMKYVPAKMLASTENNERVVGNFIKSIDKPKDATIKLWQIPWEMEPVDPAKPDGPQAGWVRPLKYWVPLIVMVFVGLIALAGVVHRQWSSNELLRYPIVEFAAGVMEREPNRLFAKVLYNRWFWMGLLVALGIHVVNGAYTWGGRTGIQIPLQIDVIAPFDELWPNLRKTDFAWGVLTPKLFITVAAFSYLLSSEVGLSLGICNFLYCATLASCISYGIDYKNDYFLGGIFAFQTFGSYLGMGLIILYAGRNYYWAVLRRALALPAKQQVPHYSVWSARVFLVCMIGAVLWLAHPALGGLDPMLAVLVMLLITLMLLVVGRINAETGLFFIQPGWPVVGVTVGMFGMEALGPKMFIIMGLTVMVLAADPRESIMPYILNGLKLSEKTGDTPGKLIPWMATALLLGLAVGLPAVLWAQYNWGVNAIADDWGANKIPGFTFASASQEMDKLRAAGTLDEATQEMSTWERLRHIRPENRFVVAAAIGLGLVLLLNSARLRWNWWPIHPILFLVWISNPMAHFAPSFFFGWIIRTIVVKLGGGKSYQKVKPIMYGLIAGDLLGGLLFMGLGAGYYLEHGKKLPADKIYQIFPY